ncbi:hypothetical protein FZC68_00600 [Bacillus pumilus]|nr:hypothetical protein FZC68_00600 [Bacillus pumilus]
MLGDKSCWLYRVYEDRNSNIGTVNGWKLLAVVAVTDDIYRKDIRANFSTRFTDIT